MNPPHACPVMSRALSRDDVPIRYENRYSEYSVLFFDGGSSVLLIGLCPFCGTALPPSQRDEWFERVWGMGLEPEDEAVPHDMRSDAWWRGTELDIWTPAKGSALASGAWREVSPVRRDISDDELPHACAQMEYACNADDLPIAYTERVGAYAIEIQDTGERGVVIEFCPFCGAHLSS